MKEHSGAPKPPTDSTGRTSKGLPQAKTSRPVRLPGPVKDLSGHLDRLRANLLAQLPGTAKVILPLLKEGTTKGGPGMEVPAFS